MTSSCASCGAPLPDGRERGRVDLRVRASEAWTDHTKPRPRQLTRAVLTATVCEPCLAEMARKLADDYGLEMR